VPKIEEIRFRQTVRPLRTTFATALGGKGTLRSVLVAVTTDGGAAGVGEVPTSAAFKDESIGAIALVLRKARVRLRGADVDDWPSLAADLRAEFPGARMTLSGLEAALFRAAIGQRGTAEHLYWGGRTRTIETDITLPFLPDTAALSGWIDYATRKGFTAYKLKISGDLEADRRIVSFVYGLLGQKGRPFRLRLDGNQGYGRESFLAFMDFIGKGRYEIELFEQPLRKDDFDGLAYIKERSPVPIILDESVVSARDARRAADHGLCHGINVKLAKSGIGGSMEILELAGREGMKLMAGCMIETMVGLSGAIFLAAGTGAFDYVDLDAVHFLYGKNSYPGIRIEGPSFIVYGP
jgi:L-alanine-DL-glutamate epimerase-like enolase superfamily enzyme